MMKLEIYLENATHYLPSPIWNMHLENIILLTHLKIIYKIQKILNSKNWLRFYKESDKNKWIKTAINTTEQQEKPV